MSKPSLLTKYYQRAALPGSGAGTLVLLHGWGLSSLVWEPALPMLLRRFDVMLVDLPGASRSAAMDELCTLDFLVEQVAEVMPAQAHILGWSLGGLVGLKLALQYPNRVLSVATIATSPCFCQRVDWPCAMPEKQLDSFDQLLHEDIQGTLQRFMALSCKGSALWKDDLRMLKDILKKAPGFDIEALHEQLMILRHTDLRQKLVRLTMPAAFLFCENDALVPVQVAGAVGKIVGLSSVKVIAGAAHLPFLKGSKGIANQLEPFWEGLKDG